MERRRLGGSDIEVSVMGIGTWAYGGGSEDYWGHQDQKDVEAVVNEALDMGVNFFDTAEAYNHGRSEEALGKRRSEAVIESKIGPSNCSNAQMVRQHSESSLTRLGTDYVDVYLIHWPLDGKPVDETFETLQTLQEEGKIRSIGVSNFGIQNLTEALGTGVRIDTNQLHYSLVSRAIEVEVAPLCAEHQIGIVPYMPLFQGILSGKYRTLEEIPSQRRRTRHFRGDVPPARHGEPGAEKEMLRALDRMREISARTGHSMTDLALAWTAARAGVSSVLVGVRNLDQLRENACACSLRLPAKIIDDLDEATLPILEKLGSNPDYWEPGEHSRIR
ncbi:aldo/keto reductase [bacterium]|nr:aldo/keto reductase [bacterium]